MNKKEKNVKILIGKILRNTRLSLGLTQEQVAESLELAPRYISDIERDKTKGSIDTLVKLCNIYQVTPTYLLQDYINTSDHLPDSNIEGYYHLEEKEKQIIQQLIQYMNKSHSSPKQKNP